MTKKNEVLALETLSQVRQGDIDAMSFRELDDFVDDGINRLATNEVSRKAALKAMVPAIQRVHDALSCQGRRTDLLDAPKGLTFTQWVNNKAMGVSRATIYRHLLKAAGMPQMRQLAKGVRVRDKSTGEAGVVVHAHEQDGEADTVDVLFEGQKEAVTRVSAYLVRVSARKVAVGDLLIFEDTGSEYRYEGEGKFVRTAVPLKAGHKKPCGKAKACRTTKAVKTKATAAGQRI
jgi:hypothetical protein